MTRIIRILIITCILSAAILSNLAGAQIPVFAGREEIASEYKWDITAIYENDELWEIDFAWVEQNLPSYDNHRGKLGSSAAALLDCLTFNDAVGIKLGLIELYALVSRDVDITDGKYVAMCDRYLSLKSRADVASAFIKPEILAIPETDLEGFFQQEPGLEIYRHALDNVTRLRNHVLPEEQEAIVSSAMPLTTLSSDVYSLLTEADMRFPNVDDETGSPIEISRAVERAILETGNRPFRRRAYQAVTAPYIEYENTLCALLGGTVKSNLFEARARRYGTAREAVLAPQNIPVEVYDNLINTVNENLEPLQRWAKIKKEVLGVEELHPYDLWVSLFPVENKAYSFEQAREIILEAVKPLGGAFVEGVRLAFDNHRIDVYETEGKRHGSYSTGPTYGSDPYILINWHGQIGDMYHLAHELGHNMHAHFSISAQPFVYSQYPSFTGEVAAITAEVMLYEHMIESAATTRERLAAIEQYLNAIQLMLYWTTMEAEFEHSLYQMVQAGEALTSDELCQKTADLYQKYWGDILVLDEETGYMWAKLSHLFHFCYYVYQYSTSMAAAEQIAVRIRSEPGRAAEDYLGFLTTGGSTYAIDMLKEAGVDMLSQQPVVAVTAKMTRLLDHFEQLMAEQQ